MEREMSRQLNADNGDEEIFSSSSGISQITADFIRSKSFISGKVKNGKANCDKCGTPFQCIHPMFVIADESSEELLCYPCNYKRLGIDVRELYKSKRSDSELATLRLQSRKIEELKINRSKKKEPTAKAKKESDVSNIKTPDLFSGL